MDIKKFTEVLGCIYLASTERTKIYKGITESLDLQKDPDWYDFCSQNDSRHCNEYLIASDLAALKTDGRLLKEYEPQAITLDLIKIAVNASAPLTPSMINHCPKIKNKITNEFIFEKSKHTPYYKPFKEYCTEDWLKCWKKDGPSFLKVSGINNMQELLYVLQVEYYINKSSQTAKDIMKHFNNLNLPKAFHNLINKAVEMMKLYNEEFNDYVRRKNSRPWSSRSEEPMPFTVLSKDPEEQELFISNLKMAGLLNDKTHKNKNGSLGWNNNSSYISALLYSLCLTYKIEEE